MFSINAANQTAPEALLGPVKTVSAPWRAPKRPRKWHARSGYLKETRKLTEAGLVKSDAERRVASVGWQGGDSLATFLATSAEKWRAANSKGDIQADCSG